MLKTGEKLSHYKIISAIGKGGMGEVFLAQDTKLDRKVAIKFLNQEFSKDADKLNRFIQEAKAASALNHPNILTIHEVGDHDGTNYIVTELIDGKTLRDHLSPKESLQLNQILKIGVQVAEALSAAHTAGIVHRDIKPENIMIRKDGYAKVLDFGLAKLSEPPASAGGTNAESEDATKVHVNTTPGMVMGTVSYMSPEQARGNQTDAKTDIWSLGVVLYEMLAGKVPFSGETVNHTIVSILEKEPLLLEKVPGELQRIVRKSLTKDVEMRYQSARDLLIDLKNLRRDLDIQGELERSTVPNRDLTSTPTENATQMLSGIGESTVSGQNAATQNITTSSSSLEYAVTQAKSHKLVTAVAAVLLVAVLVLVGGFFGYRYLTSTKQINSIAVMPFENRNSDADTDYLSDGLAESLIFRLTQIPDLRVSPTSSVMRYKGKETDIAKIASELGVDAVMTGRLTKRGDNLNITVELVDARTNKSLWGEQYERKLSELLTTQREIVTEIVGKLQLKLSGESEQKLAKKYTDNNEAYQLYLKGRYNWNKRTDAGLKASISNYEEAIGRDPSFGLAYAGLADTYVIIAAYGSVKPSETMPKAKAAALRALEIDGSLAEPHAALGAYSCGYAWNFERSETELRKAIDLAPKYATAWHWLGIFLPVVGKDDEAVAAGKHAEELDPLSAIISADTGFDMILVRRFDDAIAQGHHTLTIDPNFWYAYYIKAMAYEMKGMTNEALSPARKAMEIFPSPITKARVATILAKAGQRQEAQRLVDELLHDMSQTYVQGYYVATAQLALGDKDGAFASLERDFRERGIYMQWLKVNPEFDAIRTDSRYTDLINRMIAAKID